MARGNFCIFVSVLVTLVVLIPETLAQSTDAICLTGFEWMSNSRQQPPCLTTAYLSTPCLTNPTHAHINVLPKEGHYPAVNGGSSPATTCRCNTVFYSLLQACTICQGGQPITWSAWSAGCKGNTSISVYPQNISSGTAIPAWAYLDVVSPDTFNLTGAKALDSTDPPDSTAIPGPTSSVSGSSQGSSHKSNAGAIAGGVVGGILGLIVIAGVIWWFLRRKRVDRNVPQAATTPYPIDTQGNWGDKQQQGLLVSAPPKQHIYARQPVPTSQPIGARLYDPDDPSTFPPEGIEPSTLYTSQSPTVYAPPSTHGKLGDRQYYGVAEV
ncbi:hypothetical protein QCA50_005996 [Cerrena zonata]|uniref:Transmembrane protein n=1 Tax=Cerrena zonata TaxID=2478898 RepID=A0AAW0GMR7_9APHY